MASRPYGLTVTNHARSITGTIIGREGHGRNEFEYIVRDAHNRRHRITATDLVPLENHPADGQQVENTFNAR